jgi:chromosome partitioning protein
LSFYCKTLDKQTDIKDTISIQGDYKMILSISLQKGGTGKTSLAVSIAAELARTTGSVILVDADPQGNASTWIGPELVKIELADVLIGKHTTKEAITKTSLAGLNLIPTAGIGGSLRIFAEGQAIQDPLCLRRLSKDLKALGYRYIIFDLSPGWGAIERAALLASDEAITPITGDQFGIDGLEIFADNLKTLRERMETTRPAYKRIIVNALDRRIPQHTQTLERIKKDAQGFTVYTIPVDPIFRRAQTSHLTIQELTGIKDETQHGLSSLVADLSREG